MKLIERKEFCIAQEMNRKITHIMKENMYKIHKEFKQLSYTKNNLMKNRKGHEETFSKIKYTNSRNIYKTKTLIIWEITNQSHRERLLSQTC